MPPHVTLDAITIKSVSEIDNTFPILHFKDPVGEVNQYYRALLFINGEQDPELPEYIISMELMDGVSYEWALMVFSNDSDVDPIEKGDELTVEFQCIDKGTYKFFDSLTNGVGTPTNPISNISNGALGYFSACTTDRKTIIAEWED